MKRHALGKYLSHHRHDIVRLEGNPDQRMAHVSTGRIRHFLVLQVISRVGKEIVVAAVVVVQVRHDDVGHILRLHANGGQRLAHRLHDLTATLVGHGVIKTRVHHKCSVWTSDQPHVVRERLQDVVRIAEDEVLR